MNFEKMLLVNMQINVIHVLNNDNPYFILKGLTIKSHNTRHERLGNVFFSTMKIFLA